MKHQVNLCAGCIESLNEYYPYIMPRNELEITEVSIEMCDNTFDEDEEQ